MMKALILCAGYATRLYPFTINQPKPLLPVGEKAIIDHIMDRLEEVENIDEVIIATNNRFFKHFEKWKATSRTQRRLTIINDKTMTNEDRLGAVGDIELVLRECKINEDLIVVAGDNLFGFDTGRFAGFFKRHPGYCSVALHDIKSKDNAKRFGVVTLEPDGRISGFTEKPAEPESTLVAICLYYFPANKLPRIKEYLDRSGNRDAPGHYIKWLVENDTVYGFVFEEDWYDIGDKATYAEIKEKFGKRG